MHFWELFVQTFKSGGVLMWPLAILAVYTYWLGLGICLRMGKWNRICSENSLFRCAFKDFVINEFSQATKTKSSDLFESKNLESNAKKYFAALRMELMGSSERRMKTLKILSGVAPLIGLLGTVCGMTLSIGNAAFDSSATASGISSALVTTQAGLVIAIPAWIMAMVAAAQTQRLLIALAKREVCAVTEGRI